MIATGNHLDFDSLRGAPLPEGEASGAVGGRQVAAPTEGNGGEVFFIRNG